MDNQLLHTPDGVRDIYNGECRAKMQMQDKLHAIFHQYGYQDIQTPTFEFFYVFSRQIGTTPSRDLFKFFDKEGNTLVLRPDFTPSIARSAAKYYSEEDMPVKLCYMGSTFINSSDLQGRLKETTQCGAELIGDAHIAADAEILAMAVASLQAAGLQEFQISVGHARFFEQLLEAAQLSEEQVGMLHDLINNKNFFGVSEFVEPLTMDEDLKWLFGILGNFNLSREEIGEALARSAAYPQIEEALNDLLQLNHYLDLYGITQYISFELGLISNLHYYSGIIFRGYTLGTGEPIVKGGRYDRLLGYFGKPAPAIGFVIMVDSLMSALSRQNLQTKISPEGILLVASEAAAQKAIRRAAKLRADGEQVLMLIAKEPLHSEDYVKYAQKKCLAKVEIINGEE